MASDKIPVDKVANDDVKTSWIRLLSLPRQVNPAVDMTGANCQVGQTSPGLWFLQSTIGGSANRACTIPANRQTICNVLSCELCDAEFPGQSLSDQDLVNQTRESIDRVDASSLNFIVDGESYINGEDWEDFKVLTEPSEIVLPADNLFSVQGGSTRFAAYGFYVKLPSLTRGPHTLYFGGIVPSPDGAPLFETAVNYNLTQL